TLREKKLGRDHPETLKTVANLGVKYQDAGRLQEVIPLLEEAHRASKNAPHASLGRRAVAGCLHERGRERQTRRLAPGTAGRDLEEVAQGRPATGRRARTDRPGTVGAEEMGGGRAAAPRVPGHP